MATRPLSPAPDYELSCFWDSPDPQVEDAQWCAQKLSGFLQAIQPHCLAGTEWHFLGPKDALTPVPTSVQALFTTCIRFWQARGASVHHTDLRDENPGHPLPVYWLAHDRAWRGDALPAMPACVQIKTLDDGGAYIVTTAERYNRFIDAHRELSDTARTTLRQAGLLAGGGPFLNP